VVDPLRDNGYKTRGIRSTDYLEIKNISKENPYKLEKGDRVQRYADELETAYGGPKEGSPLVLLIERNGTKFTVPYNVAYTTGSKKHYIRFQRNPTAAQSVLQKLWFKN
jgi:hypothetical protein